MERKHSSSTKEHSLGHKIATSALASATGLLGLLSIPGCADQKNINLNPNVYQREFVITPCYSSEELNRFYNKLKNTKPKISERNRVLIQNHYDDMDLETLPKEFKDFLALPYTEKIKQINPHYLKVFADNNIFDKDNMTPKDFVFIRTLNLLGASLFLYGD